MEYKALRVRKDTHTAAKILSAMSGINISDYLDKLLKEKLAEERSKEAKQ